MRKRNIRILFRLTEQENIFLLEKLNVTGLKKEQYLRMLIMGYIPKVQPSDDFHEVIAQLRAIGNNLNQIAMVANRSGYIDTESYKNEITSLRKEILEIRKIVCEPIKIKNGNNSDMGCER